MSSEPARSSRLEAVAQSFLRRERAPSCQTLIACAGNDSHLSPVSAAMYDAARVMGFDPGVLGARVREPETHAHPAARRLWIVEAPGVHEEWLARLSPPEDVGPELLLWLYCDPSAWLRDSYLFGMLRWSLAPSKSVAIVRGANPDIVEHLRELNSPDAEVLTPSFALEEPAAAQALMQQLLQGAMATASRSPRRSFRLGRSARA